MTKPTYNADYFIAKFEAIPEEKWTTLTYHEGDKSCALGHCGRTIGGCTQESRALGDLFEKHGLWVPDVNDGCDSRYPQPTPKQRILAALRDIKAKESK